MSEEVRQNNEEDKGETSRAAGFAYVGLAKIIEQSDYLENIKEFLLESLAHEDREASGLLQSLQANIAEEDNRA